jgi:AcrR family transcriptional regulator
MSNEVDDEVALAEPRTVGGSSRRTQAQRRAATRRALLEATVTVLVEQGYARLTTAGVCARAGVTRGAQAHYFATKADLVVQALLHLTERMIEELISRPPRMAEDLTGQYAALLDRMWEIFSGPGADAHLELLLAARTDEELRRHLIRFDREVARTLEDAAGQVAPHLASREDFWPLMITAMATIRGLRLTRSIASERQVRARWSAVRDRLLGGLSLASD